MPTDRSHWTVTKCDSYADMERVHIAQWQAVSGSERANAA